MASKLSAASNRTRLLFRTLRGTATLHPSTTTDTFLAFERMMLVYDVWVGPWTTCVAKITVHRANSTAVHRSEHVKARRRPSALAKCSAQGSRCLIIRKVLARGLDLEVGVLPVDTALAPCDSTPYKASVDQLYCATRRAEPLTSAEDLSQAGFGLDEGRVEDVLGSGRVVLQRDRVSSPTSEMPETSEAIHVIVSGRKVAVPVTAGNKRSRVLSDAAEAFASIHLHGVSKRSISTVAARA